MYQCVCAHIYLRESDNAKRLCIMLECMCMCACVRCVLFCRWNVRYVLLAIDMLLSIRMFSVHTLYNYGTYLSKFVDMFAY